MIARLSIKITQPVKDAMIKNPAQLKKAELVKEYQALVVRELNFRTIAEFSPVMLWMTDGTGKSQFFNKKWMKFTGYIGNGDPSRVWFDALHPNERENCLASFQAAFKAQLPFQMEYQLRRYDGEYRWILDTGEPHYDDSGYFAGYIGSSQDITERKQAELLLKDSEAYIRAIFNASPDAMLICNEQGNITMANQQAQCLLGYPINELLGLPIEALVPERTRERHPALRAQFAAKGLIRPMGAGLPVKALRKDGNEIDIEISLSPIQTEQGLFFASALRDTTERKRIETELRVSATAFESHEAMVITDVETVILRINKAFTNLTGYTTEEAQGHKMNLLRSGRHDDAFYTAMWASINHTGTWQGEIWDRRKNGEIYPKWLTITAVKDANDVVTHFVGTHIDITERKTAEEKIKQLAFYDPLTNLPNRRLLQERLSHGIKVERRSGKQLALLMLDLDRFKAVNDNLGHLAGDELLQQVAARITSRLRDVDMVARLGGDEFVVLLEDIAQPEDAARVAESIIAVLSKPFKLTQSDNVNIGVSIGISLCPEQGDSPELLMDHADTALYQAKDAGRGCFAYFSENLTIAARA